MALLLFAFTLLLLTRLSHGFAAPLIPLNWATLAACAVDDAQRVLAQDVTTQTDTNTPAACVTTCAAAGFGYAGVEFGDECHCGTGLQETLVQAPIDDCNVACTGDGTLSCGGSWRIQVGPSAILRVETSVINGFDARSQIYTFPALRPGTWAYEGCTVDTADAPAFSDAALQEPFETTLDAVNQCLQACSRAGFSFAGVEDAGNCQCSGAGLAADAEAAPESECNSLCPLPGNAGFEFCGGVDRVGVYRFTG